MKRQQAKYSLLVAAAAAAPPSQAGPIPAVAGEQGAIDQGKAPETVVNPNENPLPTPAENPASPGEAVDIQTVQKLVQMAKDGKI